MGDYADDMKDTEWYRLEQTFHKSMQARQFRYDGGINWLCKECGCMVNQNFAEKHRNRCSLDDGT